MYRIWITPHHIVTRFWRFKIIRDIIQLRLWVYFNGYFTQFLLPKTIRDKKKCCWLFTYCLIIYIFWVFRLTQSGVYAFFLTALIHRPSVLRRSGTNAKESGSIHTASSHISCVLRRLGISLIQCGTFHNKKYLLIPLGPGKGQILWYFSKIFWCSDFLY